MRGHEYVRDAVRGYLAASVPARLAAHLAVIGEVEPDPASVSFVLADSLQDIEDGWPLVAVRSTDSPEAQKLTSTSWEFTYDLEIMVACDHNVYGADGYDVASRARDRLLLAVRESLLRVQGMDTSAVDGQIRFLPGKRPERTGRGNQETLSGVALAAGTAALRVRVHEVLADLDPAETVTTVDLAVSGIDASQPI